MAKYAPHIVPTKTACMERFKADLIIHLYKAMVSIEFSSLASLIDRAKQLEAREIEERAEREQRKKEMEKFYGNQSRREAVIIEPARYPNAPVQRRNKKKWGGQYRGVSAQLSPTVSVTYGVGQVV